MNPNRTEQRPNCRWSTDRLHFAMCMIKNQIPLYIVSILLSWNHRHLFIACTISTLISTSNINCDIEKFFPFVAHRVTRTQLFLLILSFPPLFFIILPSAVEFDGRPYSDRKSFYRAHSHCAIMMLLLLFTFQLSPRPSTIHSLEAIPREQIESIGSMLTFLYSPMYYIHLRACSLDRLNFQSIRSIVVWCDNVWLYFIRSNDGWCRQFNEHDKTSQCSKWPWHRKNDWVIWLNNYYYSEEMRIIL